MRFLRLSPLAAAAIVLAASGFAQKSALGPDAFWLPVTEAEKQMNAPVVEKDAGAEAIFWRVFVTDEFRGQDLQRVLHHYVRLKVFSEKGKEKASTVEIEFGRNARIMGVTGRTIKPDGAIAELTKDAVHTRDVVKVSGLRRKAVSFAMPAVEPGAIVEYRWQEIRDDPNVMYMRLQFQREVPVQKVTYFVKPLSREYGFTLGVQPFNARLSPLTQEMSGYSSTFLENVPAFYEEPMAPGEATFRPWALLYYHKGEKRVPEKYWQNVGKKQYMWMKTGLKMNSELKQTATQAVEGAASDEEKALRLMRYLRSNLKDFFGRDVSDAERSKIRKQWEHRARTAKEILESGIAYADEMNLLFASMAANVGLEARPALVANQSDMPFAPALVYDHFLPRVDMAVKIGGAWRVYDVSQRLLPPDMLSWQEEGSTVLITDPKEPQFVQTRPADPAASTVERKAKLALDASGTVEGDVEEEWTGHKGAGRREDLADESDARRLEEIKEAALRVFPSAEVSGVQVENVDNAQEPLKIKYHIKVPGYAQRTGKRILLPPLYFQRGEKPLFPAAERRHNIQFRYAWREKDDVTIQLPAGFELEKPDGPPPLQLGAVGHYNVQLQLRGSGELVAQREFVFGKEGRLVLFREAYPQVKGAFDTIHDRDQYILALRQRAAAVEAN